MIRLPVPLPEAGCKHLGKQYSGRPSWVNVQNEQVSLILAQYHFKALLICGFTLHWMGKTFGILRYPQEGEICAFSKSSVSKLSLKMSRSQLQGKEPVPMSRDLMYPSSSRSLLSASESHLNSARPHPLLSCVGDSASVIFSVAGG